MSLITLDSSVIVAYLLDEDVFDPLAVVRPVAEMCVRFGSQDAR